MNKSIGTSVNFLDVTGTELSGIMIMIFTSTRKGRLEDELYVIMANKKYHTVRTIKSSKQLFSKFSEIDIPDNGGDLHHHFSYQKLREMFGYKRGEFSGTISISIYSVVSGTVIVKNNAYNNCDTISINYGEEKTEFCEMANDTLPPNQPYQIMTGKVNPWDMDSEKDRYSSSPIPVRFLDPNPERNEFYMTSLCGTATFKPLKFYVGMVTPPVNCKTLAIFKDPRGRAFIESINGDIYINKIKINNQSRLHIGDKLFNNYINDINRIYKLHFKLGNLGLTYGHKSFKYKAHSRITDDFIQLYNVFKK